MNITKAYVAKSIARQTGISNDTASRAVEIIIESIKSALKKGEKVTIAGFGTFRVKSRNARVGRNPRTGAIFNIPSKKVAYFRGSKELLKLINQNK